ncbi:hypothetical protein GCM10023311_09830 [Flaviramulus aquimarinus]|uniref:Secretion system C-terminal sorting domain-containing protein n=1 Tax=Flaviramulus aquimarinus TaxID=1170456 RepID=A0ABP9EUX1_9FLAO
MKKDYFIIFIILCCAFPLNAQLEGTWRIAPEEESLKVGPEPGSSLWWLNSNQTLIERACFFDDTYVFNADGSFNNDLGSETWLDDWQVTSEQCGVPLAPHDGNTSATFSYDDVAGTITINGIGAYLGLPLANNQGQLPDVTVPSSITYDVVLSDNNNVMKLTIEAGSGIFWTFKLISNQVVHIPDSFFEDYLETHNANGEVVALGDATSMGDGFINNLTLISKVENVTDLNVNDSFITNLQGIEAFTNLEVLFCQRNQLKTLDLSQNLALVELECETNQFSTLDVSNNTALKVLGCANNNLTSLDVSNNLMLEAIWFTENNIKSLNLDANTALQVYGLSSNPLINMSIKNGNNANVTYIEAQNLPSLTCIQVDDASAASYLSTISGFVDESITFSEDCGTVLIPDSNFENYLETHNANGDVVTIGDASSMGDGVLNNLTLISKVEGVTNLNVNDSNISSLQGIEAFANLEILFCQRNQLESLDVSQNLALEELECESNLFTSLDLSSNTALKVLGCALNNLSSLDVSNNLLLESIWFSDNNIQSLNLDVNTALNVYGLSNNPLVYMSIKNGNNANVAYMEALNLPTLSCIEVDDANAASYLSTTFSFIDESIVFSEDCGAVYIPDNNFENYLETHNANGDVVTIGDASSMGDGVLNNLTLISKVEGVTNLNVNDSNISSLQGIEAFANLEILFCQRNQLESLDVSQNLALEELECESNLFTSLDLSSNTALKVLGCALNNLSSLDVSNNLLLEAIWFSDNNIQSLNLDVNTALNVYGLSNNPLVYMSIKNGNNANVVYMEALNLPTLSCIEVDDANAASYLSTTFSFIDESISFSENCGDTWTVYTSDTNVAAALSSYGNAIDTNGDGEITLNEATAYTGILDLSGQGIINIQGLQAFTGATEINLSGNNISDLSVLFESNTVIVTNKQAKFKTVARTSFSSLSVLDVSNNVLENLDISEITTLEELNCSNNLLTNLNAKNGNNDILTIFDATNNSSLTCINVDNATNANSETGSYATWNEDTFVTYSEDCTMFGGLSIDEENSIYSIVIFPNPVKNIINLKTNIGINKVEIYNILGQRKGVFKKEALTNNQIDVSTYPSGFYIMNAEIDGKIIPTKFLKE